MTRISMRSLVGLATGALVAASGLIVPAASAEAGTIVLSENFDGGSPGALVANGGAALDVVEYDGAQALQVSGRANSWDAVALPTGLLQAGTQYSFSAQVRLADGADDAAARFVLNDGDGVYEWVGNTALADDAWTTVTGSYTAGTDAAVAWIEVAPSAASYLVDDVVVVQTGPAPEHGQQPGDVVLSADFEDGLGDWYARHSGESDARLELATDTAGGGSQSLRVVDRATTADGAAIDVTDVLVQGVSYEISVKLRFADGQPTGTVALTTERYTGSAVTYTALDSFDVTSNESWQTFDRWFQVSSAERLVLYFETQWGAENVSDFLIDDLVVTVASEPEVEDLTPLKDTVPFTMGTAVLAEETTGALGELTAKHFGQITAGNQMKPDAWYDGSRQFRRSADSDTIMQYAVDHGLTVYGHTLLWHTQIPDWFFQDDAGEPLTASESDKQILRDRLHDHVFQVAEHLSTTFGAFGSETNPLHAFDVVNEVVSDEATGDGLRRSEWYRILGSEYIDLAFEYAQQAFNVDYAAPGADNPVRLFINDYGTESPEKRARLKALVTDLLDRGVPVQGVGHQFHVMTTTSVDTLEAAIVDLADLGLVQAVTELDAPTGTPVTSAKLIDQGYFFREVFDMLREHAAQLFCVTTWGVIDSKSWRRSEGAPLLFDDSLQAKPAYYGAAGLDLPTVQRQAEVFRGEAEVTPGRARVLALAPTSAAPDRFGRPVPGPVAGGRPDRLRRGRRRVGHGRGPGHARLGRPDGRRDPRWVGRRGRCAGGYSRDGTGVRGSRPAAGRQRARRLDRLRRDAHGRLGVDGVERRRLDGRRDPDRGAVHDAGPRGLDGAADRRPDRRRLGRGRGPDHHDGGPRGNRSRGRRPHPVAGRHAVRPVRGG